MEMTEIILGFGGAALTIPAFIAFIGTGEKRLLRFSARFEQKLIDATAALIAALILGDLAVLASLALQGSWVGFAIVGVSSVISVALQILQAGVAQRRLDARQADPAGFFYCRDCAEIHRLDDNCYADDSSEGSDG